MKTLAGILRPGNAANSNTAADHIQVTHLALAQIPDHERHGQPVLIRADGPARPGPGWVVCTTCAPRKAFDLDYSVGFTMTDAAWQAILALPGHAWDPRGADRRRAVCVKAPASPS